MLLDIKMLEKGRNYKRNLHVVQRDLDKILRLQERAL